MTDFFDNLIPKQSSFNEAFDIKFTKQNAIKAIQAKLYSK